MSHSMVYGLCVCAITIVCVDWWSGEDRGQRTARRNTDRSLWCYPTVAVCHRPTLCTGISLSFVSVFSLYLRFNGRPGVPGLADTRMSPFWILLELRLNEIVVTTGAVRRAKLQSKCHHHQSAMCCLLVSYILYFVKFIFISFQGSC